MTSLHVASDIGGTFTDTVVIDEHGRVGRYKSPTIPTNFAEGVLNTLRDAAADRGTSVEQLLSNVELFSHGTTVATNAMLEGRHAKVGVIQTRGFGDTLAIMKGFKSTGLDEADIKQFRTLVKQPVLVPKKFVAEVSERIDYAGRVVLTLDEADVRRAITQLRNAGAEVFAVCLLWSFVNDVHEQRVEAIIQEEIPGASVTLSSVFLPRIGEYERTLTTAVNASLRPVLKASLDSFERTLHAAGLNVEPFLMQSNGGLATFSEIEKRAAATVMSGPVGGVIASQYLGSQRGYSNIVTTDMGGTSFDVGLVLNGRPAMSNKTLIGRDQLSLPSVAVRAVGAGAGSIASVQGRVLRVGPQSAGAVPGPACYDHGGTLPTVADADLVLGYLNADNFLGGRLRLNLDRARAAIDEHVAIPLSMTVEQAAEGIKTIVDNRMADLIRQMTIEQGYDPTDFALFAYGGAGPLHAFSYGAELQTREIIVPLTASVHSAFGIACSDMSIVEEISHPMQSQPSKALTDGLHPEEFNSVFASLEDQARSKLMSAGAALESVTFDRYVEMRFRTQIHVQPVQVDSGEIGEDTVQSIVDRFVEVYEARYGKGSAFVEGGVEITTFRVVALSPVARSQLDMGSEPDSGNTLIPSGERQVYVRGAWTSAAVYTGDQLHGGAKLDGLSIVEMPDTTIVIGKTQSASIDHLGNLIIKSRA